MKIVEIEDPSLKKQITRTVLDNLPEWFGKEDATREYVENAAHYPFIAAEMNGEYVGFYSLREENKDVLDMYVLGVLREYHSGGVGSSLQHYVDDYAKKKGYSYLMVLTLAAAANDSAYLKTRKFYLNMGFFDFYRNDAIFSKDDPCQIMVKRL